MIYFISQYVLLISNILYNLSFTKKVNAKKSSLKWHEMLVKFWKKYEKSGRKTMIVQFCQIWRECTICYSLKFVLSFGNIGPMQKWKHSFENINKHTGIFIFTVENRYKRRILEVHAKILKLLSITNSLWLWSLTTTPPSHFSILHAILLVM